MLSCLCIYLYVSILTLSFIPMVIQSSKCHILHQLLELLIVGNEVCLTVYLHHAVNKGKRCHSNVSNKDDALMMLITSCMASPPPSPQLYFPQTHRSDRLWLCGPPACLLCSSPPSEPAHVATSLPERSTYYNNITVSELNAFIIPKWQQ